MHNTGVGLATGVPAPLPPACARTGETPVPTSNADRRKKRGQRPRWFRKSTIRNVLGTAL
jgi:hypothetical protein